MCEHIQQVYHASLLNVRFCDSYEGNRHAGSLESSGKDGRANRPNSMMKISFLSFKPLATFPVDKQEIHSRKISPLTNFTNCDEHFDKLKSLSLGCS